MNKWHIATVGHLSRNKFWGEQETVFYHPVLATSTVIETAHGNILVDPSLEGQEMADAVYNCCGLKPERIDIIYSTHMHSDHWMGVSAFPNAKIYMAKQDLEELLTIKELFDVDTQMILEQIEPAQGELVPGISLVPLPGHTPGLQALLFEASEGKVLVTGDSIMNYEFFQAKEGYFYSASPEQAAASIGKAAQIADYIIPGHGNYFSVKAYPFLEKEKEELKTEDNRRINRKTKIKVIIDESGKVEILRSYFPDVITPLVLAMAKEIPLGAMMTTTGMRGEAAEELLVKLNEL